ncbi:MAG: hypothetical protein JNJ54_17935 [Myxococcaceae bacterium]|nr:hypothetical protein [Myxococcaceae bacterium]
MNPLDPLMLAAPSPLPVPASYAEKAMASLMQLHGELMDEKERRVELYRRLMEKEQALAELKLYVKLLEERAGVKEVPPAPEPRAGGQRPFTVVPREDAVGASGRPVTPVPPVPPRVGHRPEGWKVW